ncbi:MAG TPA: hypothetical protein VFS36_01845 [Chitinophagaceae bacterium]|jgi:hypothetical protein|nr:hypothetical protein [Chitinophagaceae bacterium]
MMSQNDLLASFNKLKLYCEDQGYSGWDPYDGLNSKLFQVIPFLPNSKFARLAWIQFFKRSAINFRKVASVEKGMNPKGIALFLAGYCNLAKTIGFEKDVLLSKIEMLSGILIQLSTKGFSGNCWGYNFDWESRAFFQPKFTPTIVASTFAANALLDAYEVLNQVRLKDAAISTGEFILNDLNKTYDTDGDFVYSYSPYDHTSVFNASLLGARLLSRLYKYSGNKNLLEEAEKAIAYCCKHQNVDGSWFYSTLPFHQWIDNFHTGFNLECINDFYLFSKNERFVTNFEKGLKYYLNTFFDKVGRSKYYNNSLYPIDIHAPSQLIVTLSKAGLFHQHKELIDRVVNWTIKNMQSDKGYFYYQRRKYYTNKIPYMRWSQAWIFYGLSHYLLNNQAK